MYFYEQMSRYENVSEKICYFVTKDAGRIEQ